MNHERSSSPWSARRAFRERYAPTFIQPTDAIIRISASCVCGSDLLALPRHQLVPRATPIGREYCGIVEEVGRAVISSSPAVRHRFLLRLRQYLSPLPDRLSVVVPAPRVCDYGAGAFVARPTRGWHFGCHSGCPSDGLIPSLLTLSDVVGTGWFAAEAASVKPGMTVAVVGDGAVGLLGVLSRWEPSESSR